MRFAGLVVDSVAANHAAYVNALRRFAPVRGVRAERRPDALVPVPGHVLVRHVDGFSMLTSANLLLWTNPCFERPMSFRGLVAFGL